MWQIIAGIFGDLGKSWIDSRNKKQELKDAKHERELHRITSNESSAGDADIESIKTRTWTDEYLVLITTAPLVFLFFEPIYNAMFSGAYKPGDIQTGVITGFEALKIIPEYWWYMIGAVYIDVLGFRRMFVAYFANIFTNKFGGNIKITK